MPAGLVALVGRLVLPPAGKLALALGKLVLALVLALALLLLLLLGP